MNQLADTSRRPSAGVIGAGRAGSAFIGALARSGCTVVAASGVSGRERVARILSQSADTSTLRWDEPTEVARTCDLLIIATPDPVIAEVIADLAAAGSLHPGQQVVHLSGRLGLDVLQPARQLGAQVMALHPVMTFAGTDTDADLIRDCPFGVTAHDEDRAAAMDLVESLGGHPVWIASEQRTLYHAALAHGSNHLVTLVVDALSLLVGAGVDDPAALAGPLLRTTLANALALGEGALTGPVARGDAATVAAHLAAIDEVAPLSVEGYAALSGLTAVRSVASGRISPAQAEQILHVLTQGVVMTDDVERR